MGRLDDKSAQLEVTTSFNLPPVGTSLPTGPLKRRQSTVDAFRKAPNMYNLQVYHVPKARFTFPPNWKMVSPLQVAVLTRDGPYWFEHLQPRNTVIKIVLTDLRTGEVQTYMSKQK